MLKKLFKDKNEKPNKPKIMMAQPKPGQSQAEFIEEMKQRYGDTKVITANPEDLAKIAEMTGMDTSELDDIIAATKGD
ncbi:MAG: hypothetical protein FWG63_07265 [Defluviitaleaceae bacterium]|nr:hypothetical protein [Defluviitaleaceae bacterium]